MASITPQKRSCFLQKHVNFRFVLSPPMSPFPSCSALQRFSLLPPDAQQSRHHSETGGSNKIPRREQNAFRCAYFMRTDKPLGR